MRLPRTRIIGASKLEESLERDREVIRRAKGGRMFSEQWNLFIDVESLVHGEGSVKTIYSGPPRREEPKPTFKIEDLVEKYQNPDSVGLEMQNLPVPSAGPEQEDNYHNLKQKAKRAVKTLYSVGTVNKFVYDVLKAFGCDVYLGRVSRVKNTVKALIDYDSSDLDRISGTLQSQTATIDVEKTNCTYLANRITETHEEITAIHGKRSKAEEELKKYHDLAGEFPENKSYSRRYLTLAIQVDSFKQQITALSKQILSDGSRLINADRAITVGTALLDYSKKRIEDLEERKQRFEKFHESVSYHANHPMLCLPAVPFELRQAYLD
ncbi:hypothetical protein ACFLZ6_01635 [Nanoarchaeota archaeon]